MCENYRENHEIYPECKSNYFNWRDFKFHPRNQIIPGRDIYYIVGQQIIDERLISDKYGDVLYNLPKAELAYSASPDDPKKIDIGLLIVDIANWDSRVAYDIVRPIELPDKG